ncbi:hypothetical protein LEP3755_25270 [Leptolyngbya sp. NIES-3755]|nr:hypothetical protein LEP3755_25270 [Leptolyngbya sp. NIES-3755]
MTSMNASDLDQAIAKFQSLPANDQLALLGLLFKNLSGSIPATAFSSANSSEMTGLIQEIQAQSTDEQVQTLGGFLRSKTGPGDEIALDPNPSKAMVELIPGNKQPTNSGGDRYKAMDGNTRLAFWYQLGQQLASGIPTDATLSSEATQLLMELQPLSPEEQASFVSQLA